MLISVAVFSRVGGVLQDGKSTFCKKCQSDFRLSAFALRINLARALFLICRGMAVIKDMFTYLRRPVMQRQRRRFTPDALFDLIKLLGFAFLMLIFAGMVMGLVFQVAGVTLPEPSDDFTKMMNRANFVFLAAIVAPLLEETLFRSWLGGRWGILIAGPLLLVAAALIVISGSDAVDLNIKLFAAITVIGAASLYLSRYAAIRKRPAVLEGAVRTVFPYAFWGSCLAFGLMHLANYDTGDMGLLLPLAVLPQFLVGVILGFVRMRFGLLCAMVFHGAYNISVLTIFTLLGQAVS